MSGQPIDLTPWLNAVVATFDTERALGALNAWGNSFPAEELPFGSTLELHGLHFQFPEKSPGQPDSLEPLGQFLEFSAVPEVEGIALLCCGEMGEQRVAVQVFDGRRQIVADFVATTRGVMIPARTDPGDRGVSCSHLHYPGDYELALALPALWFCEYRWEPPSSVARVTLGANPLFHLLALTLIRRAEP